MKSPRCFFEKKEVGTPKQCGLKFNKGLCLLQKLSCFRGLKRDYYQWHFQSTLSLSAQNHIPHNLHFELCRL